jgi:hypothetical protein
MNNLDERVMVAIERLLAAGASITVCVGHHQTTEAPTNPDDQTTEAPTNPDDQTTEAPTNPDDSPPRQRLHGDVDVARNIRRAFAAGRFVVSSS